MACRRPPAASCPKPDAAVIGAPQVIGLPRFAKHRARCLVLPCRPPLHQTMTVKYRMNGRDRRPVDVRISPRQELQDLRRTPARLLLLQSHDQSFDLERQLVSMPVWPAAPVGQSLQACVLIALDDLVGRLARDP